MIIYWSGHSEKTLITPDLLVPHIQQRGSTVDMERHHMRYKKGRFGGATRAWVQLQTGGNIFRGVGKNGQASEDSIWTSSWPQQLQHQSSGGSAWR